MHTRQGALLIKGRPQNIVSFLEETCVMKKQEVECGLSIKCRVKV